ncbi:MULTISPECIES: hypothetical protein [Thalassospira]|uniref:Uncharacterized protein n=1 Tax=Thalassospira profundimaris TaxID=502049 RepID=A0A367V9B2_9PROT|nr:MULTISPECIES: hypothetical protein [Thalassospira]KZB73277.1 hypothetical protein AUQ43_18545 [Thalassospira sp. MCCC 1A01148]RCK21081.1 hypothetical protein TH6_15035 [Thalassospira profundimaris]
MTTETETPAARWREQGDQDPHAGKYDCERSELAYGDFTDDELANAVYLCDHRTSFRSIGLIEAAKQRIRWLSRQNEAKAARINELEQAASDLIERWSASGALILENPEDKSAMRKFRDALTKAKETAQ